MANPTNASTCCPKFDPATWDGKTVEWKNKLFVKRALPQIFHMPLPGTIGNMIAKTWAAIEATGAKPADQDFLWLAYDPSPWKGEHFIHVTKEVPNMKNIALSGTFMAKVFDGPYRDVPKWFKEMDKYLALQNKKAQKYYIYYTTCPKCAKTYGHNYVVVFTQI